VARIVLNPLASSSLVPSSTAGSKLSGRVPSSSNSYLLPKRNASSTATTVAPIKTNDGISLDRPFGAPNYVQFASIDRQQEMSKVHTSNLQLDHSFITTQRETTTQLSCQRKKIDEQTAKN
jgi:hypothetical protein